MADCKWIVRRRGDHYEGTIVFPAGLSPVAVTTKGRSKREAISRAASVAKAISQNPIVASVLPPGTPLAIEAISRLAKAKDVGAELARYTGDGARRLAAALGL